MKICVYCITKNEEQFVDRMIGSVIEADEIVIGDTGSDDNTVAKINAWVTEYPDKIKLFTMHVKPWRFDVARNTCLSHVSPDMDICIALDLDEVMVKGWREKLESAWVPGTTRAKYHYVWSWNGFEPAVSFLQDKIHSRNNYRWHLPVHEVLKPYWIEEKHVVSECEMHHFPDSTKSRGQYLALLELAAWEDQHDDRTAYYLGREYFFNNRYSDAITQFEKYRALPSAVWKAERGSSWRLAGRCMSRLGDTSGALACYEQATVECPEMRESWTELAQCYHDLRQWQNCYDTCHRALLITEIPDAYITEREAYGVVAHDLLSLAAWNLGRYTEAVSQCKLALSFQSPHRERISKNLAFMMQNQTV